MPPGIYAVGSPDAQAPVVVTANYKMTYDLVRSTLRGRNIWILVLETYGINVWCAAGKGSFGTSELIGRIESANLQELVDHQTIILPILGAPGVAAHAVTRKTGFRVRYAAIDIADLPDYLDNGLVTTPEMKKLSFSLRQRLALIPVELVHSLQFSLPASMVTFLVGWWFRGASFGLAAAAALCGAVLTGTVLLPILLPWLPGASFAFKGMLLGLLGSACWTWAMWPGFSPAAIAAAVLALTSISSFYAMNFTGSTPFTSRSGVRKEMNSALPLMLAALLAAALLCGWALFS